MPGLKVDCVSLELGVSLFTYFLPRPNVQALLVEKGKIKDTILETFFLTFGLLNRSLKELYLYRMPEF